MPHKVDHLKALTGTFSGNVGIGSASPNYKLDVVGTIGADTLIADTTQGGAISGTTGTFSGAIYTDGNRSVIRGVHPTLYFRDTAEMSAMIHNNANLLYILRGVADSEAWTQVNGQWPWIWNLANNDSTCGGNLYVNGGTVSAQTFSGNATSASYAGSAGSITNQANSATIAADTAASVSTIVQRDTGGHINMVYGFSSYLNMSHAASGATGDTIFYSSTDNYIRKNNATGFRASLNVPTRTGGDASGTWGISITGNATSASYAGSAGTLSADAFVNRLNSYSSSYGSGYDTAALEMREYNQEGATGGTEWARAPRIGFHWSGRVASQIMMDASGTIMAVDNPGTGYANFNALNIYAAANVTAYSDKRKKENIIQIDNALEKVCSINGYYFNKIGEEKRNTGVIAQELIDVLPEVVHGSEDTNYSVAYGNMAGLFVEALKDLKSQLDSALVRISELEKHLS